MPGLIDLHTHAYTADVDLTQLEKVGTPYNALHAGRMLRHGLHCGLTTMRDIGGGDWSLAKALKDKIIEGPRFFYAGKILSRSEQSRVGEEGGSTCRFRWSPYHLTKHIMDHS